MVEPCCSVFDSTHLAQSTEVHFSSGKFDLSAEANAAIDSVSNFYKKEKSAGRQIRITAHTDSVGTAEANGRLSENRAAAVREALRQREIPDSAMLTAAFGETRPKGSNADELGRQRNRRATLDVLLNVPMKTYAGQIRDAETGQGIATTLVFSGKNLRSDSLQTDTSGRFAVRLPQDVPVKVDVFAKNYFFENQVVRLFGTVEMQRKMKSAPAEIALKPAKPGAKMILRNLFFVGNEAILIKASEPELPKILKFMEFNPDLVVEIGGHVNVPNVPPAKIETSEFRLSERRALLVYDYLVQHKISKNRLSWKGYGNSQMLFPYGGSADKQEQNRRVEIRVVGKLEPRN